MALPEEPLLRIRSSHSSGDGLPGRLPGERHIKAPPLSPAVYERLRPSPAPGAPPRLGPNARHRPSPPPYLPNLLLIITPLCPPRQALPLPPPHLAVSGTNQRSGPVSFPCRVKPTDTSYPALFSVPNTQSRPPSLIPVSERSSKTSGLSSGTGPGSSVSGAGVYTPTLLL